jgi:hypothetical protein
MSGSAEKQFEVVICSCWIEIKISELGGLVLIRRRFILLACFFFPLLMQAQASKPLWEIDLAKFGYQGRPPAALQFLTNVSLMPFGSWIDQQGVTFTDPKVVVIYFVVHDDPPGALIGREPSPSDPFRLVAIFLNAGNGEFIKKLDWPIPTGSNGVSPSFFFPASNGRFMVGLGSSLQLYSPDFKLLAHMDAGSDLDPIASPSGDSLLLKTANQVDGQWTTRYALVDAGTLSTLKSWSEASSHAPHPVQTIWGEELAWVSRSSLYWNASPESVPKELLTNYGGSCGEWNFVSKEELAGPVCGAANRLLTVSTQGNVVWQFDLGFEQVDGPVVASANGQRLAVPGFRWGSGRNNWPDQLTARVFGLKSGTPLLTLSVPRNLGEGDNYFVGSYGDTRFGWGGLALSPQGDLLAVKSGASVQVYRVPDRGVDSLSPVNPPPASSPATSVPGPSSQLIQQMLSWFPADTETMTAITGPIPLPKLEQQADGTNSIAKSEDEVRDKFMQFPLLPLLDLGKNLQDEPLLAAIEGSRDFLPPTGLGEMRYQGALIAVFADDITDRANSYLRDSKSKILRTEQLEGHPVAVFQEKSEEDLWTTYVAFPKPNMAVAATNADYLREVLSRINGKTGTRALPNDLPEWKHVDIHTRFWALRHYQRVGAATDPSSPFNRGWGDKPDDKAIGLTFSFEPDKSKTATITYLSGDENSLQHFQEKYFRESSPAVTQMHIHYREVDPGALAGSFDVEQIESADMFVFVLEALLGHAIYL